jgi:hypothetical protein
MDYNKVLLKQIDDAIAKFMASVPDIQGKIANEVDLIPRKLDLKGNNIAANVANLKAVGDIQKKIEKIVLNPEYVSAVKDLVKQFEDISSLQNQYFKSLEAKYTPSKLLGEVKKQSINDVVNNLTEQGISANISGKIKDILKQNITGGGKYVDLKKQLSDFIQTNETGQGALQKYAGQIVTDSLHQYSAQYTQVITEDLGLNWFMYVGSNIETTREFCEYLTKKKYIHRSELPEIVKGDIDGHKCALDNKTELPKGMINGTNQSNFQVYRGGYNCGHQLIPVSEKAIPKNVKLGFAIRPDVIKLSNVAKESGGEVDKFGRDVAKKVGATITPINYKSIQSITRKAVNDYDGDVSMVKDAVRNTIISEKEGIPDVIEAYKNKYAEIRVKEQKNDPLGYTGNIINFKTANGLFVETQVNTAKMIYAKDTFAKDILGEKLYNQIRQETGMESGKGHGYYEEYRVLDEKIPSEQKKRLEIQKLSNEYYSHFR